LTRALGGVELVAHAAVAGLQLQPGRDAVEDADVDVAEAGLGHDLSALDGAEEDLAVGRLRPDRGPRAVDRDPAVGGVRGQLAGDLADPGGSVRVLDRRRAVDAADLDRAGAGPDLGAAGGVLEADVAGAGPDVHGPGLLEADRADPGPVVELADPAA